MASSLVEEFRFGRSRPLMLDYSTSIGIIAALGLVFLAIMLGGGIFTFFDFKSLLIVIGGTVGATLVSFSLEDFRRAMAVLRPAFYPDTHSIQQRLSKMVDLARRARQLGKLALQDDIFREPDPFVQKGLELLVDDLPAENIRRILEIELTILMDRHRRGSQLFQSMGALAPSMGLIGTLIGLVQMLQNLDDPKAIGPAMATALLTTFYGALLAYLIFLPLAGKLKMRSREETLIKEMTIEGIACIAEATPPRIVEQHLLSFLPPEERISEYG